MVHALKVELSDEVYQPLLRSAQSAGRTPEELAAEWLSTVVQTRGDDPLLHLAGTLKWNRSDLSERHDEYLGVGLTRKLRDNGHD